MWSVITTITQTVNTTEFNNGNTSFKISIINLFEPHLLIIGFQFYQDQLHVLEKVFFCYSITTHHCSKHRWLSGEMFGLLPEGLRVWIPSTFQSPLGLYITSAPESATAYNVWRYICATSCDILVTRWCIAISVFSSIFVCSSEVLHLSRCMLVYRLTQCIKTIVVYTFLNCSFERIESARPQETLLLCVPSSYTTHRSTQHSLLSLETVWPEDGKTKEEKRTEQKYFHTNGELFWK